MYGKICESCHKPIHNEDYYLSFYDEKTELCKSCAIQEEKYHDEHFCDNCDEFHDVVVKDNYGVKTCKECREIKNQEQNRCSNCGASNSLYTDINNQRKCRNCGNGESMKISRDDMKRQYTVRYEFDNDSIYDDEFYGVNHFHEDLKRAAKHPEAKKLLLEKANRILEDEKRKERQREEEKIRRQQQEEQKRKRIEEEKRIKEQQELEKKRKKQERILNSISSMVGMENIKSTLKDWIKRQDAISLLQSKTNIQVANTSKNIVITGNPGVGKTMLARKITSVLLEAGFITEDKFIEVKAEDIVAKYVGHTAQKTKEMIEEAENGVFFLDEAYRLSEGFSGSESNSSFGLEAIETIMGYMDNPKNKTVFIFAGYADKMQEFLDANPGLRSRVQEPFRLLDYTVEELTTIGMNLLQGKKYNTSQIEKTLTSYIHQNMQQGILVGNGRTVTHYVNQIVEKHLLRIMNSPETEDYELLIPEDVKSVFQTNHTEQNGLKEIFLEAKQEINELIGMRNVKQEVEKLGNFQYIQNKRRQAGLKVEKKSHHMTFLGDAGTGKTTVARIIGKMFRGAGVLTNGHFVEATKDMLTAGGSIPKTVKSLVEKAKGGILFIDEAYSLANDGKGKEALDALIPLIENNRDDFICVLAGYEKDMQKLFQLNQGLISRIPNHFHFENYNADELTQMMLIKVQKEEYQLGEGANQKLQEAIELSVEQELVNGNGRWIRNFFEQILMVQNERLFQEELKGKELTVTNFSTITPDDITEAITTLHSITTNSDAEEEDTYSVLEKMKTLEKLLK